VFKEVIDARARCDADIVTVYARPNGGVACRLGISIGRRVGTAARRNRVKRLIREAFRLSQREHPSSRPAPYDLVVVVRPHEEISLADYMRMLQSALERVDEIWRKREARRAESPPHDTSSSPSTQAHEKAREVAPEVAPGVAPEVAPEEAP
jgi:ribonuclease P protein component